MEHEKVKNIQYISSVNIRVSHEVIGCADSLLPYITKNQAGMSYAESYPRPAAERLR